MPKNKLIPVEVVVSMPRAGEFITKVQLDPHSFSFSEKPTTAEIANAARDRVWDKLKVKVNDARGAIAAIKAARKATED